MPHNSQSDRKVILNNLLQKIESREQYGEKMQLRSQEEKEIKVELMMKLFLVNIDESITLNNKGGQRKIEQFTGIFMNLVCDKILAVSSSNFIQYIPFYVILKAKPRFDGQVTSLNKNSCCELLFTTCFISELINRSFPMN